MKGKRILITGGAGLIGSTIADQLAELQPAEIVVLDNFVRGNRQNLAHAMATANLTLIEGDIMDRDGLRRAMTGVDIVFHMAAIRITQCAEEPRLALEVMVDGAYNVYEAAVDCGIQKLVSASTASVYGMAESFPTDERHHPYNNRTFYGAAKAFNEGILRSFNDMYDLNYLALRFFNVYGPRMDIYGVFTEVMVRWMERIEAGEPPLIFGDGSQTMDFVYVGDVARANILAAQSDAVDRVFNVASGTETSLAELATTMCRIMGRPELQLEFAEARKVNPVQRRLADTRAAREVLGFQTQVDLETGLRNLVAWWREKRDKAPG